MTTGSAVDCDEAEKRCMIGAARLEANKERKYKESMLCLMGPWKRDHCRIEMFDAEDSEEVSS